MSQSQTTSSLTPTQARQLLWTRGQIAALLLDANQRGIWDQIQQTPARSRFVLLCGRRVGKTWLLAVLAISHCLQKPGANVKFAAQTQKAVRSIIQPVFRKVLATCPDALRPVFNKQEGSWTFRNGSKIVIAGAENADRLRGQEASLAIIDEAGFVKGLTDLLNDVLRPQLLKTNGRIVLASSPPKSPAHEFVDVYRKAQARGTAAHRTIYDAKHLSEEQREGYIAEAAADEGLTVDEYKQTVTFRREWLAEIIKDEVSSVIPEFDDAKAQELTREVEPTHFRDRYVGIDVGFRDATAVLFGWWWFDEATLVIEDELFLVGATTEKIAQSIKEKERQLWGVHPPLRRVYDTDARLIADLRQLHRLHVDATEKKTTQGQNKEATISILRSWVRSGKLIIHPRCKKLIATLLGATWNSTRTSFERTKEIGHADALDALVYLTRAIYRHRNPVPANYGIHSDSHFIRGRSAAPMDDGVRALLESFDALPDSGL